jgi:hypothetical protein
MSGNSQIAWTCLFGGILLQLTYMVLPLQRWDWARYLGAAALPLFVIAKASNDNVVTTPQDAIQLCGVFTLAFALIFQRRLLPRLGEGSLLMWTAVLLCVIVEMGVWNSTATYVGLGAGFVVIALLVVQRNLPYALKVAVYGWFLLAVVAMGVLQFRRSDYSLMMAGRADQLDYRFAFIDGMAGAYIGVHAAYLYELLPIPGKGEQWKDFKTRWEGYLDQVVLRFDNQRLSTAAALALIVGIALLAFANHAFGLLPDRTLANLVLLALPIAWRAAFSWWTASHATRQLAEDATTASATTVGSSPSEGIGRARHSKKHRQL